MIKEKKFLLFFFISVVLIFFIKISLTQISYIFISKYNFNNFIISKNIDERIVKMMLLKKSEKNFDTYFFGSSSATVFYPNDLKNLNINSFNASFSGGNTSEHLKYLNWILKNRPKPKHIYLELRDHSLLDRDFNVAMPPDLLSLSLKVRFYLTDFSTFKFIFNNITNYNDIFYKIKRIVKIKLKNFVPFNPEYKKTNFENKSRKLDYLLTGTRYYQSYFDKKKNKNLQEANNKKIINDDKFIFIEGKIDDNKMIDLKKIIEICELYNIDYKIFFGPVYKNLLIKNEYEYLSRELFIIEQILKKNIVDKIYYFNNNEYSQNIENFGKDLIHYNYDIAYKIAKELVHNTSQNTKSMIILTKDNFKDYKNKID
jgi:hypothetical protein